jgi:hypothetical protein
VALVADAAFSAGVSAGPLQGLLVSIKDLFAAKGYPWGSARAAGAAVNRITAENAALRVAIAVFAKDWSSRASSISSPASWF